MGKAPEKEGFGAQGIYGAAQPRGKYRAACNGLRGRGGFQENQHDCQHYVPGGYVPAYLLQLGGRHQKRRL